MTIAKNMLWKLEMIIQTDVRKNFFHGGSFGRVGGGRLTEMLLSHVLFVKVSKLARLQLDFKKIARSSGTTWAPTAISEFSQADKKIKK